MPTGRVLVSELDYGGLNFPTAVQRRQGHRPGRNVQRVERRWSTRIASGSPSARCRRAHRRARNRRSTCSTTTSVGGSPAQHVGRDVHRRRRDVRPPVPIAQPGSDAYLDLQCSDSGGPSNITVNPDTGRDLRVLHDPRGAECRPVRTPAAAPPRSSVSRSSSTSSTARACGWPARRRGARFVEQLAGRRRSRTPARSSRCSSPTAPWTTRGTSTWHIPSRPTPYPDLEGAGVKMTWQTADADGNLTTTSGRSAATLVAPCRTRAGPARRRRRPGAPRRGRPGRVAVAYYWGEIAPGTGDTL